MQIINSLLLWYCLLFSFLKIIKRDNAVTRKVRNNFFTNIYSRFYFGSWITQKEAKNDCGLSEKLCYFQNTRKFQGFHFYSLKQVGNSMFTFFNNWNQFTFLFLAYFICLYFLKIFIYWAKQIMCIYCMQKKNHIFW